MTIIDRYVLGSFIRNYLIAFLVLIGMYIALDMVFNFPNLMQSGDSGVGNLSLSRVVYDIANFYFYESFLFFVQLSGMIAVVAASFTLMRLSRFNETTALLAAGMPLQRVSLSVILAGVVLNLVLLPIDQELLIPRMIPKLTREHNAVHQTTVKAYPVNMLPDSAGGLFNAAQYYPPTEDTPARLMYMEVIERDAHLEPIGSIYAKSAVWDSARERWNLTDGRLTPIASPLTKITPAAPSGISYYQTNVTPDEIALNNLGKDYIKLLPTARLNELLDPKRANRYGSIDLLRTKHMRFTQPIANVVLLIITIACVLTREPGTLKLAVAKCMAITGLCMGCVFLCYELAGTPPRGVASPVWPALMAWIPIFIFGPVSAFMLDRIKT